MPRLPGVVCREKAALFDAAGGYSWTASDLKDAAGRGESGEGVLASWQAMGLRRNGFG